MISAPYHTGTFSGSSRGDKRFCTSLHSPAKHQHENSKHFEICRTHSCKADSMKDSSDKLRAEMVVCLRGQILFSVLLAAGIFR